MKKAFLHRVPLGAVSLAVLALAGCGAPAAKDYGGAWRPVNRFQDAPTEIPLAQPYTFYASPMDGTLRTMLARWSKDSDMQLSYQLASDFTLYKPVSQLRTSDIHAAAATLNSIYAAQGVSITVNGRQILARQASPAAATAVADGQAKSASKPSAAAGSK